ncbi:MAG TPA: 5'-methylthioadenosine/S-adenosylhomocysteine nucleosidase [Anaerolineales bacterium]|nr:5'-methylthioadenosine/S-adenosylhomocysteine nucleosidase [Anaerolineales bacterium]
MTNRKSAVNKPTAPLPDDQQADGPVVVLISADAEWRAMRKWFPDVQIQISPYGEWFRCRLPGLDVTDKILFLHGGWGKIAAAGSTQYAISRWSPRLLINLGTCGGLAGEIERGTIILVNKTIVYDIIEQMGDYDEHLAHYTTEIDLSWLHPPYPQDVQENLLISADRDILTEQIPWLKEKFGAVAADWESAAIAYVAAQNHTRIIILRAVTDLVAESGGEAYGNLAFFQLATEKVMANFVQALPAWINAGSTA